MTSLQFAYAQSKNRASKQAATPATKPQPANPQDLLSSVNPFIGTTKGRAFPGATTPFGMIQLSPDTDGEGVKWANGYHYGDSVIVGFSHTHQHGAVVSDLLDVALMPTTKNVNLVKQMSRRADADWAAVFSHKDETASPGYYRVKFPVQNVTAELTATQNVGVHRYTFPASNTASIVIDLSTGAANDVTTEAKLQNRSTTLFTGYRFSTGAIKKQQVFFAMELSKSFTSAVGTEDGLVTKPEISTLTGKSTRAVLTFTTKANEQITVKVALSSVSVEGALDALGTARDFTFEQLRKASEVWWIRELDKFTVQTKNRNDKIMFATAYYHTLLALQRYADVNGAYAVHVPDSTGRITTSITSAAGIRGQIFQKYHGFMPAMAFETNALLLLTQPERAFNMAESYMSHAYQFGSLPKQTLWGNELSMAPGFAAARMAAEFHLKGYIDVQEYADSLYYKAGKVLTDSPLLQDVLQRRYIPFEKRDSSVYYTQEIAYTEWAVARTAKFVKTKQDVISHLERSQNWQHLYDREIGFIRARSATGQWKQPFDTDIPAPEYAGTTARVASWFAPHDVTSLAGLNGGYDRMNQRLDTMFVQTPQGTFMTYAHTDPRQRYAAYLPLFIGTPFKVQERIRPIVQALYANTPDGLAAPDEGASLSAWLVFNMAGIYPFNAPECAYFIGRPLVEKVMLWYAGLKKLTISTKNFSEKNVYIKTAKFDDEPMIYPFITHLQIQQYGGKVELEMTDKPTKLWERF